MCLTQEKRVIMLKNRPRAAQRNLENRLFNFLYLQVLKSEMKAPILMDFLMQIQDQICMKSKFAALMQNDAK